MADDRPQIDLYTQDFYLWTQAQAQALRAQGAGPTTLDYDRLAEEIGDLGSAEWNRTRTLLIRIVQHLHKLASSPAPLPQNKWRREVRQFRVEIGNGMPRSIRNGMEADLDGIHRSGAKLAQADMDDHGDGVTLDPTHRWSLAQLLGEADDPLDALR